jgi:hypothetical protein
MLKLCIYVFTHRRNIELLGSRINLESFRASNTWPDTP